MVKHNDNSYKKTIAVFIFMITAFVFLSVNVFAETPIQPLQVVTYSDTTTNVRISGTAERLHYNIDSFQVVFMSPPNNYGTSCTPVLVSFRFYNASDTPAYVGQAEFELTATSGTGSVNTIIYGYDQISTDLFVAESSYSTAEVGRIGIGASNDFAYYTGFVIPPHTSLYFSCIVYVNASAYAQNNTGATEDVNQVTLSALNFYNNQISFSSDYPYHNEPIDFSEIINSITSLSETVSTSSEMSEIIDLLTYSGDLYQYVGSSGTSVVLSKYFGTYIRGYANIFYGTPYLISVDQIADGSSDNSTVNGSMRYPVLIRSFVYNNSSSQDKATTEAYNEISNFIPVGYVFNVQYFASEIYGNVGITADGHLRFYPKNIDNNYQWILGSRHYYNTMMIGYVDVPINMSLTWPTANINSFFSGSFTNVSNSYNPPTEYTILRDLYLAYSEVNGLDDSSDISNDVANVSDSNHVIEESYYSANASAIEATGLSNYHFTNEQNNGIGSVANDFMLLWNALGSWNGVYIFSLTLALATFIMRHGGLFSIKRETSDKGGEGD